jgi:hypothetical protein
MEPSNQSEHKVAKMQSKQSLTLRRRSFPEGRDDRVAICYAKQSWQYIGYA